MLELVLELALVVVVVVVAAAVVVAVAGRHSGSGPCAACSRLRAVGSRHQASGIRQHDTGSVYSVVGSR